MTSIKRLIDSLLENWIAKVVSLLIAIILYILYQAIQIDKKTISIPLKIQEDGLVMHVGNVPNSLPLQIRTNETIMNMINASDFEGVVDISYITEPGTYDLPVQINLSEKIQELDPLELILKKSEITLNVDKRITKYVALSPSVVGEVAHGYSIDQITISPSTVEISGPKKIVDAIDSIPTTRINVSNAENNFSVETECQLQNKLITINDKETFTATISLAADIMEKTFNDIKIEVLGLSPALFLEGSLPDISITLSGEVPLLEKFNFAGRVAFINLRDFTEGGVYDVPVRYNVPAAFSIVSKSLDTVAVLLEEVPVQDEENPEEQKEEALEQRTGDSE